MKLNKEEQAIIEAKRSGKIVTVQEPIEYKKYAGKLKEKAFFLANEDILYTFIDMVLRNHSWDIEVLTESEKEKLIKEFQKAAKNAVEKSYLGVRKGTRFEYDEEEGSWHNEAVYNNFGCVVHDTFEDKFLTDVKEIKIRR